MMKQWCRRKGPLVEDRWRRAVVNIADRAVITGKLPDGSPLLPETAS